MTALPKLTFTRDLEEFEGPILTEHQADDVEAAGHAQLLPDHGQEVPPACASARRLSGVSDSVLSRFLNRKQGITLDTAERLARVLHLALT